MADPDEPLIETCHACGALIDVSDAEPLALLHCPSCGAGMRVRKTFGNFELQEVLGAGGMGAVYRALDKNLNRSVALKLLRREFSEDEEFLQQFRNEASITASINHPNVVKVYAPGEDHGQIYIAMELVDKGSLDDLMTLQGRVAEVQVLEVGVQIARGLKAALQRGLIHRDIKPGNILFANAQTSKIVDFGLAVLQEHAGKVAGEVWGTPYYVAPEKLDNQPEDFRSDIYSLGATLFHAVAGRPPFEAETASLVALKHVKSQAVSLQAFAPDVSSATAFVINKTLNKDPAHRYQSYDELIEHLDYARNELLNRAKTPSPRARVALETAKEQRVMSWFTFGMVALVVLGGVFAFVKRDQFFGAGEDPAARQEELRREIAALQKPYGEAREELIKGNFRPAARTFQSLAAAPGTPQPMLNWFTLHAGLALLFSGDLKGAQGEFARIEARGVFSQEPSERKLAQFFLDLSRAVIADAGTVAVEAKDFNKTNYESIGLLVLALKQWDLSRIDDAGFLLRQFQSSTPQPPYEWIANYKTLLTPYLEDFALYRGLADAFKADTNESRTAAIQTLNNARTTIKMRGGLLAHIEQTLAKFEAENRKGADDEARMQAETEAADAPKIEELKTKVRALLMDFKIEDAHKAIEDAGMESAKGKAESSVLAEEAEWMSRFRKNLIADLEEIETNLPLARKNGDAVPVGRVKATDKRMEIWVANGRLGIPWEEVTPEAIFSVAKSLLRPELTPDDLGDRKWDLGVYAALLGRKDESQELTLEAAQLKGSYQEKIPVLEKLRGG